MQVKTVTKSATVAHPFFVLRTKTVPTNTHSNPLIMRLSMSPHIKLQKLSVFNWELTRGFLCKLQTMTHFSDIEDINAEIQKISQFNCDLVFGYCHENDRKNDQTTPDGVINICLLFAFRVRFESSMLTFDECEKLNKMIGDHRGVYPSEWKLLYRGSRDGYKMKDCHPKCYSKQNVVVILKTKVGNIFGGFTEVGWDLKAQTDEYRTDPNAFLFLIRPKTHSNKPGIWTVKDQFSYQALYHYKQEHNAWLFLFGRDGTDLNASQDCNQKRNSGSSIFCFENKDCSEKYAFQPVDHEDILRQTIAYQVAEIECFQLQK